MKNILLSLVLMVSWSVTNGQVVVSESETAVPDPSAMLDISATDKGMLIPRMTEGQRKTIAAPAEGLWVYQTGANPGHFIYSNASWTRVDTERKLIGKILVDGNGVILPAATRNGGYTGYTAIEDNGGQTGTYLVTFATPFATTPIVQLTSSAIAPPLSSVGTGSGDYCTPTFNNACVTTFAEDVIDKVVFQPGPTGVGSLYTTANPCSINDAVAVAGGACEGGAADNYVNRSTVPGTFYSGCAFGGQGPVSNANSMVRLVLSSTQEWPDNLWGWIDWGQDTSFDDPGDLVFFEPLPTSLGPGNPANGLDYTMDFLVPSSAVTGETILRTRAIYGGPTDSNPLNVSCQTFGFGETQDYKIIVSETLVNTALPRGTTCSLVTVSQTGFRVSCTSITSGDNVGTDLNFYVSDF